MTDTVERAAVLALILQHQGKAIARQTGAVASENQRMVDRQGGKIVLCEHLREDIRALPSAAGGENCDTPLLRRCLEYLQMACAGPACAKLCDELQAALQQEPFAAGGEDKLREALERAAETFREYSRIHAAKRTVDGNIKCRKNIEMAKMCESALQQEPTK